MNVNEIVKMFGAFYRTKPVCKTLVEDNTCISVDNPTVNMLCF